MKGTTLLILCAVALSACSEEPSTATTANGVAGSVTGTFTEMKASPAVAPAVASRRVFGIAAGAALASQPVATEAGQADEASSQSVSAGDPLQNVNASAAATMVIRTGQGLSKSKKSIRPSSRFDSSPHRSAVISRIHRSAADAIRSARRPSK
jgi:hypothetical protein